MSMPVQKPGKSVQEVQTPPEFMRAVKQFLGIEAFSHDLAANDINTQASTYYDETDDAFTKEWARIPGWLWLNPPYGKIEPWLQKAWEESNQGAQIAVLIPASVGANWWNTWVDQLAEVHFLNGRITFVGHESPYPKDLALVLYHQLSMPGYRVWQWKQELDNDPEIV